MNTTKIVAAIVSLAVAIVCAAVILMPAVDDAADGTQKTFTNSSTDYAALNTGSHTITVVGNTTTLDSDTVLAKGYTSTYAVSDNLVIAGSGASRSVGTSSGALSSADGDITITFADGTATITQDDTTYEVECESFWTHTTTETEYVWAKDTTYISADTDVLATAKFTGGSFYACVNGVGAVNGSSEGVTTEITKSAVSGYDDLYTLTSVSVSSTELNIGTVVPVSAIATYSGSDDMVKIVAIIPTMVIVAILVGAVALAVRKP